LKVDQKHIIVEEIEENSFYSLRECMLCHCYTVSDHEMLLRNPPTYNINKGAEWERRRRRKKKERKEELILYSNDPFFFYSPLHLLFRSRQPNNKTFFFPNTYALFNIRVKEEKKILLITSFLSSSLIQQEYKLSYTDLF
jgi:hypothetical protein